MDAIYGMTMQMLAETMSKHSELRTQYGEQQGTMEFEKYLASRGLDMHTWSLAHNGWHDRWKADPTGRLQAEFVMIEQQLANKAHFGDVRDMSQDTEEGVTLDTYAQITVAISRAGANAEDVVREHGLTDVAHWQRANAAWSKKMGEDTTHKLTMQYGQLYSKHAGPSFQAEMIDRTAAMLAASNAPRDVVSEPEVELTPALCLEKLQSPSRNERWKYAGLYAHMADLGNVPNKLEAIATVTPVLIDMIEQHDEHTTSDAENGARKLWDLGVRGDDFKGAIARCLNRAQEKLASLQAAFAPIQNQAVPERITLQTSIQDYQSLVSTMQDYMREDWGSSDAAMAAAAPAGAMGGAMPMPMQAKPMPMQAMPMQAPSSSSSSSSGGFPKWVLVPVILVVVGGGIFAMRARSSAPKGGDVAASASVASASAPATLPSASAAASAAPHAAPQPATPPSAAAKGKKKGK